jgi:hypothetical protein
VSIKERYGAVAAHSERRLVVATLAGCAFVTATLRARAEEPGCGVARPWVEVTLAGLSPAFARRLLGDLRAGLAGAKIDACEPSDQGRPEPRARLRITSTDPSSTLVHVGVEDPVTSKRVERDTELSGVPADGRAFAVALAADELFRASSLEIALFGEPTKPEPKPEPPAREAAPRRTILPEKRAQHRMAVGIELASEWYRAGQAQLGADVTWFGALSAPLGFMMAAGVRKGLAKSARDGEITSSAVAGRLGAFARLVELRLLRLDALFVFEPKWVRYDVQPRAGAIGEKASGFSLYGLAGLSVLLGDVRAFSSRTSFAVGAPLRAFSASDAGNIETGVAGFELSLVTGLSWGFD